MLLIGICDFVVSEHGGQVLHQAILPDVDHMVQPLDLIGGQSVGEADY
jgi:hypothetical protein